MMQLVDTASDFFVYFVYFVVKPSRRICRGIFGDRPRERLILTTEYTEYTEQWGFAAVEMREIW